MFNKWFSVQFGEYINIQQPCLGPSLWEGTVADVVAAFWLQTSARAPYAG